MIYYIFKNISLILFIVCVACQNQANALTNVPTASQKGDVIKLSNKYCELNIDSSSGEIKSLVPGTQTLHGKWFEVIEEDRTDMEPWETWKNGKNESFTGNKPSISINQKQKSASILLKYATPNGNILDCEIKLDHEDKGPLFRMKVTNQTGRSLVDKITMPVLTDITIGKSEDDWFTWPHTLGTKMRVDGFNKGQRLEDPYPGFMYMQWLDLYDDNNGVYIGCNDDYGYSKSLFIGKDDAERSIMGISFTGCWIAKKGDSWTTPWVQIVSHKGDWRIGADIYRAFAQKAFGPINPPELIKDMPAAQCWLAHHASNGDIGDLFEIQQQAPIHASYLTKSMNTSIPEGWDGFHGSALEYQDSFDKIKKLGGNAALFTFDRAVLMGRTNYADYFSKWLNVKRDGSFEEAFIDMMPSPFDPDFVRARVGEAVRWVRDFGLDELHYDTEGTSGYTGTIGTGMISGPSYDMKAKQRPNEVPHYFKELYKKTLIECRKYNPKFTLRAEHCADFFYPEFSTSTAHYMSTATANVVLAKNMPQNAQLMPMLFCYTLPQHAVYQLPSVSANDFWIYGYGMGHGFHGGGPSWCFNPGVRDAESPSGELLHRYRFYDDEWRMFYDFRVGFNEAVIDGAKSDKSIGALIDGKWTKCELPGPIIAVTHIGGGREVTLGMWYGGNNITDFAKNFAIKDYSPQPTKIKIPTSIKDPIINVYGSDGIIKTTGTVRSGIAEIELADPTCFAIELSTGPQIILDIPKISQPGMTADIGIIVKQKNPIKGKLAFQLPNGWNNGNSLILDIPNKTEFAKTVQIKIPQGIFGRNYPIKAVFTAGNFKRTVASHMKVMEPLTFLYGFTSSDNENLNCIDIGKNAKLKIQCINNTPNSSDVKLSINGEQINYNESFKLSGTDPIQLGDIDSDLCKWIEGKGAAPNNVFVKSYGYACEAIPIKPINIKVFFNGKIIQNISAYPRTRLIDLNGKWKAKYYPKSNVTVAGVEGGDSLDMKALTPDIWDGKWETIETPIDYEKNPIPNSTWAIYRKLVYIPAEWQGTDIWLRLNGMGNGWGQGTLSLVYVNGWPAGRIGQTGEKELSSLLKYGAWNLLAIGSFGPDIFADSYIFARNSYKPERIKPQNDITQPSGAFMMLDKFTSGQGITLPFIKGVIEEDHRRTNNEMGGENQFIYFAVADDYIFEPQLPIEIEIEYLDNGTGDITVSYDSYDESAPVKGAFKSSQPIKRTDSGTWKKGVFILNDAKFSNREHMGSDFRIGGEKDNLHIKKIDVRVVK